MLCARGVYRGCVLGWLTAPRGYKVLVEGPLCTVVLIFTCREVSGLGAYVVKWYSLLYVTVW